MLMIAGVAMDSMYLLKSWSVIIATVVICKLSYSSLTPESLQVTTWKWAQESHTWDITITITVTITIVEHTCYSMVCA